MEPESSEPYSGYPGRYTAIDQGDTLAQHRLEKHQAGIANLQGRSICRIFSPGYQFVLLDFPRADIEPEQVLHSVNHEASQSLQDLVGGDEEEGGGAFKYRNTFTTRALSVPFRPPQRARKPPWPIPFSASG